MQDFFQTYFIDPINNGSGYNIYNTLVYAVILILAAYVVYKFLRKMKIQIDNRFLAGVLPYIIFGGLLRSLEDASSYGIWLKTPLIYIVIFVVAFMALFASKIIEALSTQRSRPIGYYKIWAAFGFALVIVGLTQVTIKSDFALAAIVSLTVLWAVVLIFLKKLSERTKKLTSLFTWENTSLLGVHMFDASTTFTAIQYFPYFEQHVLPSYLINFFGPVIMFALKFAVVAAVLYVLEREMAGQQEKKKFVKLIILILGLAPGLRNFFRLIMGV